VPLSSVGDRSVDGGGQDGGQLLSADTKLRCVVYGSVSGAVLAR
jgi:hypothetical protein